MRSICVKGKEPLRKDCKIKKKKAERDKILQEKETRKKFLFWWWGKKKKWQNATTCSKSFSFETLIYYMKINLIGATCDIYFLINKEKNS